MPNFNTNSRIPELNLYPSFDAIVYQRGSLYYAENRAGQNLTAPTVTAATAIQAALDSLTPSRTWKETVLLKGSFTGVATMIDIPSYTRLVIDGIVKEAASTNLTAIFNNANRGSSLDSNIEVCGGIIDGNESNSGTGHGILFDGVQDCSIHDTQVNNIGGPSGRGIYVATTASARRTERVQLHNINSDNTEDSSIECAGSQDGADATSVVGIVGTNLVLTNPGGRGLVFTNTRNSAISGLYVDTAAHRGLDCSYNSTDNSFTNMYIANTTLDSIAVADSPGADPSDRNVFSNFVVYNSTERGVSINASDCSVTNGLIYNCGLDGLRIDMNNCTVTNVTSKNNGQTTSDTYSGIDLRGTNIIVSACHCYDDQGSATQRYGIALSVGSANCRIYGNDVSGNVTAQMVDVGTNNRIYENEGYITENKGTGTIANGATNSGNVAHGLSYTPVASEFNIMFTENPTNTPGSWWISGIDATNFVLNVENDPGASGLDFAWSARKV